MIGDTSAVTECRCNIFVDVLQELTAEGWPWAYVHIALGFVAISFDVLVCRFVACHCWVQGCYLASERRGLAGVVGTGPWFSAL